MSLWECFGCPVDQQVIEQAGNWAASGAVEARPVSADEVQGAVSVDDQRYEVSLRRQDGLYLCSCECQADLEQGICAHVAAVAQHASVGGFLPEILSADQLGTVPRKRGRNRPLTWLSSTGELRGVEIEDTRPVVKHEPSQPTWKKLLTRLRESDHASTPSAEKWGPQRRLVYIVDVPASFEHRSLVLKVGWQDLRATGQWSQLKFRGLLLPALETLDNEDDQKILLLVRGLGHGNQQTTGYDPSFTIPGPLQRMVMAMVCRTGRAMLRLENESDDLPTLTWDDGPPWEFWVTGQRDEAAGQYEFSGHLRRGQEQIGLSRPALSLPGGLIIIGDKAGPLHDNGAWQWLTMLRQHRTLRVPVSQAGELLGDIFSLPHLPPMELPAELQVETIRPTPRPKLFIRQPIADEYRPERLRAHLSFDYDGLDVPAETAAGRMAFHAARMRMIVRDEAAEEQAVQRLWKLGLRQPLGFGVSGGEYWFNQRHLQRVVRSLVTDGWRVDAQGQRYRQSGTMKLSVSSGIDWFELRGEVDFEGHRAKLPDLLAAIKSGQTMVRLDDGSMGMVPEAWLKKYGLMAGIASQEEDHLRFSRTQVGILDALLASQGEVDCDEVFQQARKELWQFEGIAGLPTPAGFIGELRPYQCEGLGWFGFLERFGFGGCLADDMGLGKTVQVLALLQQRHLNRKGQNGASTGKPSLVVVPKSLVFNWQQEAERFAPTLRLLDHTGIDRIRGTEHFNHYDLIITTYGTLRRDATFFKDVAFDYVILDEAQAIKNPASESAKAIRLVRGGLRLALSGTPVQNHLGDLWSLFEFLNPGMLGMASVFNNSSSALRNPDEQTRSLLARSLRPFILRRTKEQVASELPARLEQTLYCQLEGQQKQMYDELREHYRRELLERIDRDGIGKSKMQILEALLRLRQAALHPGLIDKTLQGQSSAKLDVLLPQIAEVIDEGHKALVFSQFTSMLAIVRQRLDQDRIVYEYLDGKTKDRAERVERFQTDEKCRLFLISLKAGGLGLNLTAADYVFLLDPWWNPAVEQQAIDRAHRIGQTKQVYACRLIAKDTVEEKVLSLQQGKRDLAEAIITADNSLIRTIGRQEIELLLS